MKSIQTKFFEELQRHLDDKASGELIVRENFANQGTGYIQKQETFNNYSIFSYHFDSGYATFEINSRPMTAFYARRDGKISLDDVILEILKPVPDPKLSACPRS